MHEVADARFEEPPLLWVNLKPFDARLDFDVNRPGPLTEAASIDQLTVSERLDPRVINRHASTEGQVVACRVQVLPFERVNLDLARLNPIEDSRIRQDTVHDPPYTEARLPDKGLFVISPREVAPALETPV